jgi:uracil-DNA glycosylase
VLGGTAGAAVFGPSFRVGGARGRPVDWPDSFPLAYPPAWVLPTTHPSAVLRTKDRDAAYDALVADLMVAAQQL